MLKFWVRGGEFSDKTFSKIAASAIEERHGPFESYSAALAKWRERTMATIDDYLYRYRIEREDD